ncbi:MAG: hypothetical protein QOH51_2707 [Acidobacteriota bacterium]|nr:hypothetical protein [Acidobacteriota bacterium]
MATASTKRARKKRPTAGVTVARKISAGDASDARRVAVGEEIPERAWLIASIIILMLATALRVYALELKPLHHDEGVNGFFLTNLLRPPHHYSYDPANYHGPTLYYLTLPLVAFTGLSTFVIRFVPALFGVGTVWLVLALRRRVGALAALTAAALIAVSPACVFYSRYFIHEMSFVFFTLGIVVAALRFYETGAAKYVYLAAVSAAMLFATKETAFISVGTLGLAWLVAFVWVKMAGGVRADGRERNSEAVGLTKFRASGQAPFVVAISVVLFVFIWILFYSSFFTNWKGVLDSFKAFDIWKETGMSEFHRKPLYTYVKWLLQEDAPIFVLGSFGAVWALFESRKNRFVIFAAAWGCGLLAAYSLISYKTPWLVLNFVVPLSIVGGYAVQQAAGGWASAQGGRRGAGPRRWAVLAVAAVAVGVSLYQSVVINFREYDNDQYPYVYSQTYRQVFDLIKEVELLGARAGTKEPGIGMASPDYWPLPWYFRDDSHAGFEGRLSSYYDPNSTSLIIGREDQLPQLQRVAGDAYVRVGGLYPLRPGVNLVLFERADLAGK